MNTSNVNAIANSNLEGEIDTRRGHAMRSYFKRQSRRQVRHRLAYALGTSPRGSDGDEANARNLH
jgi:hypothetical protein